jgi:hypothetical protein
MYDRFVLGKFARGGGTVFPDFTWEHHVKPWPGGTPDAVSYGVDWGWGVPSAIIAVAWRSHRSHVVEESYGARRDITELIEEAGRLVDKWGRGTFWCDPENPEHIKDFNEAGLHALPVPPEGRKVMDGIGVLNDALRGKEAAVAQECVNLLREIPDYDLEPGKDKPQKGNDHAIDAWRYAVVGRGLGPAVRLFRESERGGTAQGRGDVTVRVLRASKQGVSKFRRKQR